MFVDLYFPPGLDFDRDEIQQAIEAALGADVEVVGAGVGREGSNLDLALSEEVDRTVALQAIERTLTRLGIPDATLIQISDADERITLRQLRSRTELDPATPSDNRAMPLLPD
jgi:hypothetical protein